VLASDGTQPIDWNYISQVLLADQQTIADWPAVFAQVQQQLGSTFGDLVRILAQDATLLPTALGDPTNVADVLDLEVTKAQAAIHASISGKLETKDLSVPFAGASVYAEGAATQQVYQTYALNDGSFIFPNVVPDTYTLSVDGALVDSGGSAAVASNTPVTGVAVAISAGAEISGQVLSQTGNQPIAGAKIEAANEADGQTFLGTSDANGNYDFRGLPAGVYDLVVDAAVYARKVVTGVDVTSANALETVTLSAESSLTGSIRLADGGPGESGLQILAVPASNIASSNGGMNQVYSASSDLNTFTLGGLPGDSYDVTISMPGYIPESLANVSVLPGQTLSLGTITLDPASEIAGTITSSDPNTAPAGLTVEALQGGTVVGSAVADDAGSFQIADLPAGTYTLALPEATAALATAPTVSVTTAQTVNNVAVEIQPGGIISGTVSQTTSNALIAGIPVFLSGPGGLSKTTATDSNGNYRFSGLGTGDYQVYLLVGGSQTAEAVSVTSLDGTVLTANLQLAYVGIISGNLTDGAGQPITDGTLTLFDSGSPVASATADQSGAYEFLVLQPGTYDLMATASQATFDLVAGITVKAGDALVQNFQSGSATVTLTVSDGGQAVAGDVVALASTVEGNLATLEQTNVGSDGTASFANLVAGNYTVIALGPDGDGGQSTSAVPAGASITVPLTLAAQGTISGTVTDANGKPVRGASVIVQTGANLKQGYSGTTLDDGSYSINGLPQGSYDVTMVAPGYQASTQTAISVPSAIEVNATLVASTTSISGTVTDASGKAVPSGTAAVVDSAGHILGFAFVQPDGSFAISSAFGNNLKLQIDAPGYLLFSSKTFDAPAGSKTTINPAMAAPLAIDPGSSFVNHIVNYSHDIKIPPDPEQNAGGRPKDDKDCQKKYDAYNNALAEVKSVLHDMHGELKYIDKYGPLLNSEIDEITDNITKLMDELAKHGITDVGQLIKSQDLKRDISSIQHAPDFEALRAAESHFIDDTANVRSELVILHFTALIPFLGGEALELINDVLGHELASQLLESFAKVPDLWPKMRDLDSQYEGLKNNAAKIGDLEAKLAEARNDYNQHCKSGCSSSKPARAFAPSARLAPPSDPPGDSCQRPDPGKGKKGGGGGGKAEAPHDPNNIIGPAGFGDQNFVTRSQVLPYQIDFENEPTAGLPAQQVVITQQLDANLNWQSFRLGSFGFGGATYTVPANTAFYQTRVDLTQTNGYFVDVSGTIDVRSGVATWTFTTIDPTSGQIPLDPTIGFLPPDASRGIGEGFVSYTIQAKPDDPTGTVINAQARVVFSTQPPLDTGKIFNTIDAGASLTSSVAALPAVVNATSFGLSWSGTGDASGSAISSYSVYVSDNGGPFTAWLPDTTLTQATYIGQFGHTYGFYSVATDNTGNVQAAPTQAQTTTSVQWLTTTSLASDQASGATYGQSVTFTATVAANNASAGTPTGTVQFAVDGSNYGNPVPLAQGSAGIKVSGLAAGAHSVTAAYSGAPAFVAGNGTLTNGQMVNPATLTITADDQSMVHGSTLPALTATYTGLVNGDTSDTFTTSPNVAPALATAATSSSPAGIYAITPSGAVDANYTIRYASGTLHVARKGPPPKWVPAAASDLTHSDEYYTQVIIRAYQHYLGRTPDALGLAYWLDQMKKGLTDEHLESNFIGSKEYIDNHGGAGAGWVKGMYQDLLGRTPAQGEVDYWMGQLNKGVSTTDVAYMFAAGKEREGLRVTADYQAFLGRNPSPAEIDYWVGLFVSGKATNEDVVAGFAGSTEYFTGHFGNVTDWFDSSFAALWSSASTAVQSGVPTYLAPLASTLTHSDEYYTVVITDAYQHYLGRTPDSAGLAYWLDQMKKGQTDEHLEANFIGSTEYIKNHGGAGAGWVKGMYQDLLGRTPSQAEIDYWVGRLNAGMSTTDVAYGFAASKEREGLRITADYTAFLGRSPSQSEIDYWVNLFLTGKAQNEDVVAGFISSKEYFQKYRADAHDWVDEVVLALLGPGGF
jgi:hypothetical protein